MKRSWRVVTGILIAVSGSAIAQPEADVTVVVAQRDLAAGSVVKVDDVAKQAIPAHLYTSSIVKPDAASYVIGQRLVLPLLKGDTLLWSAFETAKATEFTDKCKAITHESADARQQVARSRQRALSRAKP